MGKHSGTNSGLGGFMNGASIRFSKMKGSGGAGGVDAWRDMLTNRNPSAPSAPSSARRPRTTGTELPKLQSIHEGTVVSIQPFGAFMQLGNGDMYKDGLLHLSCMAKERVEKVEDAGLELDMKIWVKVSEVKEMDGKYSLDMRYVNQKDGTDLDPYHTKGRVPDNFFEGKFKRAALAAAPPVAPPADSDDDIEPDRKDKRKRETKESSSESDSGDGTGLNVEKMPPKLRKKYEKARSKLLKARQQHASLIEKASALPSKREVKEDKSKKAKDKVKEKEKAHKKEKEVLSAKLKVKSEPSSSCSSSSSSS